MAQDDTLEIDIDTTALHDFDDETPTAKSLIDARAYTRSAEEAPDSKRPRDLLDWILPLDGIPYLAVARGDMAWFDLSATAALLVTRVDGKTTMEGILARTAVRTAEAVCELRDLVQRGVVRFR